MEVSQKKKNTTTNPGYVSEENKNTNLKRYVESNVNSSIIYNSQHMDLINRSTSTDKEDVPCINAINGNPLQYSCLENPMDGED